MITHVFKDMLVNIPIDYLYSVQASMVLLDIVFDLKCARAVLEEAKVPRILNLGLCFVQVQIRIVFSFYCSYNYVKAHIVFLV